MNLHYVTKQVFFVTGCLLFTLAAAGFWADEFDPARYENDIRKFEEQDRVSPPPKNAVLFLGSSSIRLWDLEKWFPGMPAINRGFGGSQIADSVHFAGRILIPYEPRIVVFYAGDNDIAKGKSAETVRRDFQTLLKKVHAKLPDTKFVFVAIKPSIKRWNLVEEVRRANQMIVDIAATNEKVTFLDIDTPMIGDDGKPKAELFADDGLHLNDAGYALWSALLKPYLRGD